MKTKKTGFKNPRIASAKAITMIALISLAFVRCGSDDVAPIAPTNADDKNAVNIDGQNFNTQHGFMFDFGKSLKNNSRNFVVDLTNGTYDGNYYSSNTTTIVSIDFNSASQSELVAGAYTLDQDTDANGLPVQKPNTFSDAYAHVGLTYQNGNLVGGLRYDNLTSGSITVKKITSGYEITYDLAFEGGLHAKGTYSGKLVYYEI